ncbi:Gac1/Pig1 [Kluyveromyces lactis]|nr:Gac1/Pig1 [Kluyveromyces lactis]
MDSSHSTLTLHSNVSDWLSSPTSSSASPGPMGFGSGFFHQENDSVETITLDNRHRRVSNSNKAVSYPETPRSGFGITHSCSNAGHSIDSFSNNSNSNNNDNNNDDKNNSNTNDSNDDNGDDITKCISNLSVYDLLNSTQTASSSSENSSSDTSDGGSETDIEMDPSQKLTAKPTLSVNNAPVASTASSATAGKLYRQTSHPPIMRKLKSSLKLSSASSQSSISSSKSVRFASELTKVKRFDSSREPVTISNETSPQVSPLDHESPNSRASSASTSYASNLVSNLDPSDSFWFGTQLSKMNLPLSKSIPKFSLSDSDNDLDDSDSDFDVDYLNDQLNNNYHYMPSNNSKFSSNNNSNSNSVPSSSSNSNTFSQNGFKFRMNGSNDTMTDYDFNNNSNSFNKENINQQNGFNFNFNTSPTKDPIQIKSWILKGTNIKKIYPTSLDINQDLSKYLQGNNIKLHECNSLQLSQGKLTGLIYVNNLSFEKFIEIKFSFNGWKDIHYVTANFKRTITDTVDEFQFVINLSSFVYFLKVKNLILFNSLISPLTIQLCCRYDVNGETYYDNNNYENYQVSLDAITNLKQKSKKKSNRHRLLKSSSIMKRSLSSDNFMTDGNYKFASLSPVPSSVDHTKLVPPKLGRRFSEDTDFFNSSPLKNVSPNYTTTPLNQKDPKYDELIKSYCFYDPNSAAASSSDKSNKSTTTETVPTSDTNPTTNSTGSPAFLNSTLPTENCIPSKRDSLKLDTMKSSKC